MSVIGEERARGGVFKDVNAEDEDAQPTEIESLCMNCYENVSGSSSLTHQTICKQSVNLQCVNNRPDSL